MEITEHIKKLVLEQYPELDEVTMEFLAATSNLGGLKQHLKAEGVHPRSGLITHVGKVKGGILLGITLRGFTDADESYESYKDAQHRPVLLIF